MSTGGICSQGSREWWNSYRYQMYRWCRVGCREDNYEQASETGCEQEDSNSGSPCWNCEPPPIILLGDDERSVLMYAIPEFQVSAGLNPDGRHFVARARDEASSWRSAYKAPVPTSALANRLGSYVQAFTLYSSVRPFGVTSIVGGWDSEGELAVDGQVGTGPKSGAGGKVEGAKAGGPGLYMIEQIGRASL